MSPHDLAHDSVSGLSKDLYTGEVCIDERKEDIYNRIKKIEHENSILIKQNQRICDEMDALKEEITYLSIQNKQYISLVNEKDKYIIELKNELNNYKTTKIEKFIYNSLKRITGFSRRVFYYILRKLQALKTKCKEVIEK